MVIDNRLAEFLDRCDAVSVSLRIRRATLSTLIFRDGKRLNALASGKSDIGIGRLARAERELTRLSEERNAA